MSNARISLGTVCVGIGVMLCACTPPSENWQRTQILSGLPVHGLQGLNFGPDGALYIGSVMSEAVMRLDVETGRMTQSVGPPLGEADDVAFGPDGTMAWTALNQGALRVRTPAGEIESVAENLPFVNPVTFGTDGILYAATLFGPDRLWAYDLTNGTSRVVTENVGGLNGFEFGTDGLLYTPLPQRQSVGRIDTATGELEVIAEGVGDVVGVAWHPDGFLYAVSWSDGRIVRVAVETGAVEPVTTVEPPLDNLAIGRDGTIYVTRSADNGVVAIDPESGAQTVIVRSDLAGPGGMTWVSRHGREQLLITSIFGYRFYDPESGDVELPPFDLEKRASSDASYRDGKIALTYVRRNRALLVDIESGNILQTWPDLETPYGVLLDNTGDLIVALHTAGTLVRLSAAEPDRRDIIATGLAGPVGLGWADEGASVYVVEAHAGQLSRIDLETGTVTVIAGDLTQPESVAVLPDGRIAVAEVGTRRVLTIDPVSGVTQLLADGLALGGSISRAPDPIAMPTGLAVDASGAVWVVTDGDNGLVKLTPP